MTKPRLLTEKQTHFLEAWALPMQPSFGYAHGLINYLCDKPEHWNRKGIPRKQYVAHMIDNFWKFHAKWVGKDVVVIVRDKETSTIIKKSFKYVNGVIVGIVGRPVGECAFLKAKYGYVVNRLKLQVMLEGTKKAKVMGIGKISMVKYHGEQIARIKFDEHYKLAVENQNTWKIKSARGGRLLATHLATSAKDALRTR